MYQKRFKTLKVLAVSTAFSLGVAACNESKSDEDGDELTPPRAKFFRD